MPSGARDRAIQGNDEDNTLEGFAKRTAEETALGVFSGLPVVRDIAKSIAEGGDYKISPLEQAGQSFVTTTRMPIAWPPASRSASMRYRPLRILQGMPSVCRSRSLQQRLNSSGITRMATLIRKA
jgi:hypothetical protein